MKYLKLYEDFENSTYDVKKRYTRIGDPAHWKFIKNLPSFEHEYFTARVDGKIVSSCIITYPRLSTEYIYDFQSREFRDASNYLDIKKKGYVRKAFFIYAGTEEELFSDKDDKFVKIYSVVSRKVGKGYGKLLFEKLKEYLISKGKNRIYLDVDKENLGAQEFYKKIGFKKKYDSTFCIGYVLNFQ